MNGWDPETLRTNERIAANKTRKERWKGRIVKCVIATISLLSYSIMDCVSEIFRCFCFFLSLTIQFLFFPVLFSVQPVYFLSDRAFNAFGGGRRKGRASARVIFYFSHDFLNEDNTIYSRLYFCWLPFTL